MDSRAILADPSFLRRLAKALVHDDALADDVAQEAWVVARESPPHHDASPRGWLASVVRSVARSRAIAELRRAQRERAAAHPEALPSAAEMAQRLELHESVVAAVRALDEPYKTAIYLRYFEDLTPSAIATRSSEPVATVKTRLRRGLDHLRAELDRDYGDRSGWCAIALVLPKDTPTAPHFFRWIPGGLTMSLATKIAAGSVLALATTALALWQWNRREAVTAQVQPSTATPSTAAARHGQHAHDTPLDTAPANTRSAIGLGHGKAKDSSIDRDHDLHGIVVDPTGAPIAAAAIDVSRREWTGYFDLAIGALQSPDAPTPVAQATSAEDGTFAFPLAMGRPHALDVRAAGFARAHLPNLNAGEYVVVHLTRGASIHGSVTRKSDGSPVIGAIVHGFRRSKQARMYDPDDPFRVETDALGRFHADGIVAGHLDVEVAPREDPAPLWLPIDLVDGVDSQLDVAVDTSPVLQGRVTDATTGAPIANAELGEGWWLRRSVRSDANGDYEYKGFPLEGTAVLGVCAEGYGYKTVQVREARKGAPFPERLDIQLLRARTVRGRVLAHDSTSVPGAYVAAVASQRGAGMSAQETDWRIAHTGADGHFEISSVRPDLPHVLLVRKEGFGSVVYDFPPDESKSALIELGDIVLETMGVVRGVVVDGAEKPLPDHLVTLHGWNSDRENRFNAQAPARHPGHDQNVDVYIAGRSARTDDLGRFAFVDVPNGEFQVRALLDGVPDPIEAIVHVAPGATIEGVKLVLDEGLAIEGRVIDPNGAGVARCGVRLSGDSGGRRTNVSATTDAEGLFRAVGLAAGAYRLTISSPDERGEDRFARAQVDGVAAGVRDVVIRLKPAARIEGVVLQADGTPAKDAMVLARTGEPNEEPIGGLTDEAGHFLLFVAEGATVDLEAYPSAEPGVRGRIASDPAHAARLSAVTAGGKPVELRLPSH